MRYTILLFILFSSICHLSAHDGGHGLPLQTWKLQSSEKVVRANFIKLEGDLVWLVDENHQTKTISLTDFSPADQDELRRQGKRIYEINTEDEPHEASLSTGILPFTVVGGVFLLLAALFLFGNRRPARVVIGTLGASGLLIVSCNSNAGESYLGSVPATDLSFIRNVFHKFDGVTTKADDTYFYVASDGLPDHEMMVGITNWQQQVPVKQDYTGDNSWAIPLQPKLAEHPLSTRDNLLKGAIAIAANGIPIFNPLNNRGEDANAIGELDNYGGHCGRVDDYHYHLPPTHLQSLVGAGMPIAYAVDGFPVYGPTGEELDEYLGRFTADSSYQYHAIAEYPYFIAGMRGEVKLDPRTSAPENQVVPQARTQEIRPALRPLRGATITGFAATGDNSYSLNYTLNSEIYRINYGWNERGLYTYKFVGPDGSVETNTYQK